VHRISLEVVLQLHHELIQRTGGSAGIRDLNGLKSALAQPRMTFGGQDLYPTLVEKAVALGFSLIQNHPFVDGNKRVGHAVMELFLFLHGFEIDASADEQETIILQVAASQLSRSGFVHWVEQHLKKKESGL